jgi:hypothetical protein
MKKKVNSFVKVHGNGHARCVAQSISDSWEKECYSNVRLIAKDSKQPNGEFRFLSANKFILAAASKNFAMMLVDTDEEDVTIIVPDHDFSTLKLLLEYIYSGEVFVDCFAQELHSLIAEWNICNPEVIPITPVGTTSNNSHNVTESQALPGKFKKKSNMYVNKKIHNKEKTKIVGNDSSIDNHQLERPDDNLLSIQTTNECMSIRKVMQTLVSGEDEIPLIDNTSENLSSTGNSNHGVKAPKVSLRNINSRGKSSSAAASIASSGYVFLATYINKSKNKLQQNESTSKTKSEKKISSIPQMVEVGGSTKSAKTTSTLDESGKICEVNSVNVDGEKSTKAIESNVDFENGSTRSDDHQKDEVAEVNTEQDLNDLTLALKLLKDEKKSNQELNTSMLDLSNKVQRHKSYAKHFLGLNGLASDSSGQIGIIMFIRV